MRHLLLLPLLVACTGDPAPQAIGAALLCPEEECEPAQIDVVGPVVDLEVYDEPGDGPDVVDGALTVMPGYHGAWQRLQVEDEESGLLVEAWFLLPGAAPLAELDETVELAGASPEVMVGSVTLRDEDGALRAWVGEAESMRHPTDQDVAAWMEAPDGASFAEGEVAWSSRSRCGEWEHRDLVFDDGDEAHDLEYGSTAEVGALRLYHGGHTGTVDTTSSVTCDAGLGPAETVRAAALSADFVQ